MKLFTLLFILLFSTALSAQKMRDPLHQVWEKSLPFLTSYNTDDYKAALQNWAIIQDKNGIIYAANNSGILQFDGTTWRLAKTPLGNAVRSLAKDKTGRIYAGGTNEIGYLEADGRNEVTYHSLKEKLESADQDFGTAWFTFAIKDDIYFVCDQHILKWSKNKFKVWNGHLGMLGFAWVIDDVLFVDVSGLGLMKMQNDELVPIPGSTLFKGMGLIGLLPYEGKKLLCTGLDKSFFIYDGASLTPFKNNGNTVRLTDVVYHGTRLASGDYALGTTGSGFYLMDNKGNLKNKISRQEGLNSDAVYAVYEDAEGDVWLATDNGISRLEINSPMRVLNEKHGLDENPFDIEFFNNKIYTSNSKGLFQLNQVASGLVPKYVFKKIKGVDNLTLHCQLVGNELIISNYDGIFSLDKNEKLTRLAKDNVVRVEEARNWSAPGHLLFGTDGYGVGELLYNNGQWKVGSKRIDFKGNAESFTRATNGNIFVNTKRNGIFEIAWKDPQKASSLEDEHSIIHHNHVNGLSSDNIKSLEKVGGDLYASTDLGMHKYSPQKRSFVPDSMFDVHTSPYKGSWINEIVEGRNGQYWLTLYHNYESHIFRGKDQKISKLPVSGRFSDALISKIFDTGTGIVLFGSNKWIVLYDENLKADHRNIYKTLIRRITIHKDSLIAFKDKAASPEIDYKNHDLRFEFSLPSYDLSSKNQYQYFLEGFNDQWSAWSGESFVDFTNLPEGNYTFRVRGKNVYDQVSGEDQYLFTVLPPWHRTWWAYAIYAILLVGITAMIIRVREQTLQAEKAALEAAVTERTEKILVQTEELKEMDRMKSRFFANISHEFRTPLTLILGPLEEELNKKPPTERNQLQIMKRYANRLLELVNQLLNLSKLEAGKMELQITKGNLNQFLSVISSSFDSLAQHKQIEFVRNLDIITDWCWYDADKLEKVLTNLLANAFKFTPAGGTVTFTAKTIEKEGTKMLSVDLADTGKGIPKEEQERVFQSFYQTRQTIDNHEGGTGLGLALVKELVKLHKGTVRLTSVVGSGSVFSFEIPVEQNAFSPEDIVYETRPLPALTLPHDVSTSQEEIINDKTVPLPGVEFRDSILVVEDNPELRHYMAGLLEKEYVVYTAPDGLDAFEQSITVLPNLVLSDLMMPRMNGMELTEKMKTDERTSHIPVILLTAKSEQQSRIDGLKHGADDYLTKPFSTEELMVRVRNLIDMRKKLAERFRERILVPVTHSEEMSLDDKFLHKVRDAVEANMQDDYFSVEKMAEELNLSRTQLLRKLKALTGLSPTDFIRDMRLKKAAEMIRQKADTITQIGYAVGFSDQSYFTKCFKKQFGVTPTEYSQSVS